MHLPTNVYGKDYKGVILKKFSRKITKREQSRKAIAKIGAANEVIEQNEYIYGHRNAVSVH